AGVERGHLLALLPPGGQHDDGDGGPAADAVDHLGAVHVGQAQVQDDHVGMVAGHGGEPGGAVGGGADVVFAGAEVDLHAGQDGRLVVDDEHPGHAPAPSGEVPTLATGSVTWMVSPPPGVSAAAIVPPMASAKPLATASPSPTPGYRSPARAWGGAAACP